MPGGALLRALDSGEAWWERGSVVGRSIDRRRRLEVWPMRRLIAVSAVSLTTVLTLSGCMWQTASGNGFLSQLSGPVTGFPITGAYQANITGTPETFGTCGTFSFAVTMTDSAGNTVTKNETGTGCPLISGGPLPTPFDFTYSLTGTYNVTGGTGIYAGATGTGTSNLTLNFHWVDFRQSPSIQWSSLEFG